MDVGRDDIAEIQSELQAVKRALQNDKGHLGMTGETLQRYFLQLNEKENLLLSRQVRASTGSEARQGTPFAGAMLGANGGLVAAVQGRPEPQQPPAGAIRAFDKSNLLQILAHMCDYEANAVESAKALRALSSLAYSDAQQVGEDDRVLQQVLRLLAIHSQEELVQQHGLKAIQNMVHDKTVATRRLCQPGILAALLQAIAREPEDKDGKKGKAASTSREAVARMVVADVEEEPPKENGSGVHLGFFGAALAGEASTFWHQPVLKIVAQLVETEVILPAQVAQRFSNSAAAVRQCGGAGAACGWLSLARQLAGSDSVSGLPEALVESGAIRAAGEVMGQFEADGPTQLAGIEAMSSLIGNRWAGLLAFAEIQGVQRIEVAMRKHGDHAVLQTKGLRALACGIQWPDDVQKKSGYVYSTGIELTKSAMSFHGDNVELQTAGMEALSKYLDKVPRCVDEVKQGGGEGLIKAMMMRHVDVQRLQQQGRSVLDSIGVERNWTPKGSSQ